MPRSKTQPTSEPLIFLSLAVVCYVFFFHGLWSVGLLGPDEPRYAAVAREMLQSRDFVTPRLHGNAWFEKPVLFYWSAALSFALFGINEFAARLPSALAASASVYFMYMVCRKLWGQLVGLSASLMLASSVGYFAFARAAAMDMLLAACLAVALLAFLRGCNTSDASRRRWFAAFYGLIGLGVLAKGPVAILLPVVSLAGYQLFNWRTGEWKNWHLRYVWITLAVASPWYIAVMVANGFSFIRVFFLEHNFGRFATTVFGHQKPIYYYIPALILLMLPWTAMLIPGLRRSLDRSDRILLWFAIVPMVFFSLSGSKLPGYILPCIAPLVMICARGVSAESSREFRLAVFIEAGFVLILGLGFGLFGHLVDIAPHIDGTSVVLVSLAMGVSLVAIGLWMRPPTLVAFNAVAMFLIVLVTTGFVLNRFESTDSMRPWRSVIQTHLPDSETVYLYQPARWMEYGMQFYRFNKALGVASPQELQAVFEKNPHPLFVSDDSGLANLSQIAGVEVKIIETVGNQSLFWVSQTP